MRKGLFPVFCSLVLASLFAARCRAQAAPKLAPELRAFVKEDAPLVALTHVRVIDGTGAAPRADQTLVIREGKIASLGDAANTKIPEGAKVLDLSGRTIIPGLVGMHDHMYYPAPGGPPALYPEHAASFPRLYLAGGVTSIRTTGSIEPYADLELKRRIDDLEHGLVVDTEFLADKKPGACPNPAAANKALLTLVVASGPIHEMIHDLVAHHVAITSTLPVFETFVPNRAPLDSRVLDAMQ